MTTNRSRTAMIAGLGLGLALSPVGAHAERYRVSIGNLPPMLVDDARSYATRMDPAPVPPVAASPSPAASHPAPATVAVSPDRHPAVMPSAQSPMPPVPALDADRVISGATVGEPTAAFRSLMAKSFTISVDAEVRGIWYHFAQDASTVSEMAKAGNAVIRWMLATRRAPTGMTTARPDLLPPDARRGTVRAIGGVPVRATPWGESTGASYAEGATMELRPPAHGVWYRVTGPGPTGWVPGVWIDLKQGGQ